jgi:hypothetical protein
MLRVMPQNWEPKDWAEEQARRVASQVSRLREPNSTQWLSDQTAATAGYRVSRSVIADLENGRRRYVTTAELCALSWALKVPPIRLLYPDLPDGQVEVIPGKQVPSIEAAMWFSGEFPYVNKASDNLIQDLAELKEGVRLVSLARERVTLEGQIRTWSSVGAHARKSKDRALADMAAERLMADRKRIEAISEELQLIAGAVVVGGG